MPRCWLHLVNVACTCSKHACIFMSRKVFVCPPACVSVMETYFSPVGQAVRSCHTFLGSAHKQNHTHYTGKYRAGRWEELMLKKITYFTLLAASEWNIHLLSISPDPLEGGDGPGSIPGNFRGKQSYFLTSRKLAAKQQNRVYLRSKVILVFILTLHFLAQRFPTSLPCDPLKQ